MNILKEILTKEKLINTLPIKSLVVMANPKTILNKTKCSKDIQKRIYKYDQVITFLKGLQEDKTNDNNNLEIYMHRISDYLLQNNKPLLMDFSAKYALTDEDLNVGEKTRVDSVKEIAVGYEASIQNIKLSTKVEESSHNDKKL